MERRRVVITAIGAVSPLGNDTETSWQAVKENKCGIAPITSYDTSGRKVKLAAEVKDFNAEQLLGKKEAKRMGRFSQFAVVAAKEAMKHSGLDIKAVDAYRCGISLSSGIGGIGITEVETEKGRNRGWDRMSPFYVPTTICNMAAGLVAIETGFKGMCTCPVTACAGGTNAIGDSFRCIRDGYAEVMLCGGAEASITPLGIGGFSSMKALCTSEDVTRGSIPFDKERSGFVMGEGAALLMLEELEHARNRGADIIGEIIGYGATCDAYHMTVPNPDGSGGAMAMAMAIADGGISPCDVDYINAHGTSTVLNDAGETLAIKTVFGDHAKKLCVSSTKSMTGHLLGAAGGIEAAFTALSLKDGFIPATINYQVPDQACDLDVVPNVGRKQSITYAMSNSFGFGGHNASLLFKKWGE